MQTALSAQSSIFVASRLSKATSTSKVTAPRRAAPVRCMAFDAKQTAKIAGSTVASFALLMQPAMADYSISDDLKGVFDTPAPKTAPAPVAAAAPIAVKEAPAVVATVADADESAELKAKALALKAELQAGLAKPEAAPKKVKSFTKDTTPKTKEAKVAAAKAAPAPKAAKEAGDPSFLIAMVVLFSPFLLVTGYNFVSLIGAIGRSRS